LPFEVIDRVRRREYPEAGPGIFFNSASWGLMPRSSAEESADLTLRRNRVAGFQEEELGRIQRRCRDALASLLRVDGHEIALSPNTSYGVNLAAALVRVHAPGTVLVAQGEFPANVFPWKALAQSGFRVEVVPAHPGGGLDEEALLRRLDSPGVRALALSAVQFATGHRADLALFGEACRERGILFCVDAIQALGAVPLYPREVHVDVLASGGQKWLCGPWGSGFTYIREGLLQAMDPPMVSWLAVDGALDFDDMSHYRMDYLPTARRFELATLGVQDYLGLARSVEIFLEMGVPQVEAHIHEVLQPLVRWIGDRPDVRSTTPLERKRRAGILSFVTPRVADVAAGLSAAGVVCSLREGAIRFAPHFYNTTEEMEEAVRVLERLV
jgi:selenocysteine lyase/cysteine desulfurase